jgi:hypothetical protein
MIRQCIVILLFMAAWATAQELQCPHDCVIGEWSNTGIQIPGSNRIRIPSPDGSNVIHTDGDYWWLDIAGKKTSAKKFPLETWREFGWAPDSQAFYLTQSEGFTTGYHTEIYRIEKGGVVRLSQLDDLVQRDFERRHRCRQRAPGRRWLDNAPNRAGVSWTKGSSELLMVSEVPPVGICREAPYFAGYLVSISSRRIVARYSPEALLVQWGNVVGKRLKDNFKELSEQQKKMAP